MKTTVEQLIVRDLGMQAYEPTWHEMQRFTAARDATTPDELWVLEHPPVFTMGLNGKEKHLLSTGTIPVINIDRGGQVTYHGPGQLVIYTLLDLSRLNLGVKELVKIMETAIIDLLKQYGIHAQGRVNAPGVYVNDAKIAALGLRIKKNKSYHGLSLNLDMDLTPFQFINPCGYAGMTVTQLKELKPQFDQATVKSDLITHLSRLLGYNNVSQIPGMSLRQNKVTEAISKEKTE
jgi:lipoyl(octanoyl) transferase